MLYSISECMTEVDIVLRFTAVITIGTILLELTLKLILYLRIYNGTVIYVFFFMNGHWN